MSYMQEIVSVQSFHMIGFLLVSVALSKFRRKKKHFKHVVDYSQ